MEIGGKWKVVRKGDKGGSSGFELPIAWSVLQEGGIEARA